jgi:membrane-associated phospholipid phosphatase
MHRVFVAVCALAAAAHADDGIPNHHIDPQTDRVVILGALAAAVSPMTIPVRHVLWDRELLGPLDPRDRFSRSAAKISDATLAATIAAPLVYMTNPHVDDATGDRYVIYGETLAVDLALVQVAKYLIQRPRPYVYNKDAGEYTKASGDDAWVSFYSSHAAMTFGAATAGAYLLGASGASKGEREVAWGAGFAAAGATANLRVRAGKHFYSDVIVGGLVGIGVGYAVPALHATGKPFVPSAEELSVAASGLVAGIAASELVPLHDQTWHGLHPQIDQVGVAPMVVHDGAGVALRGRMTLHGRVHPRHGGDDRAAW